MKRERIVDQIEKTAQKYPKNIALEFMGKKTDYSTLVGSISDAAAALKAVGVEKNDIICIAMPNMPQAIIMIYAANKIGAVVNMIHPLSSENELLSFVNRVNAKVLLIIDQFADKAVKIKEQTGLRHIIVAGVPEVLSPFMKLGYALTQKKTDTSYRNDSSVILWPDFLKKGIGSPAEDGECDSDAAFILHSGGTTGKVKGVCLSNSSVIDASAQMIKANPMLAPADRFLSVMPIFHGNGLVIGVHTVLVIGARCVLIPRFTPETYSKDLLKYKCNYMSGVPALFEKLMDVKVMQNADLSFLKCVFSGADYLSADLERRINAFLKAHNSPVPVRQGYGMTEGVVASMVNPWDRQKEGSIGVPLEGVDVKIVEPGTETELPTGETGEIVFSSTTNMMYYYDDPEETDITMWTHSDGRKWIHSGDLGYVDEDGFFFFKGRIKRMIVTNGYNVFPNELENIIEGFRQVNRCCVLAVPHTEGTDRVSAFIVLNGGYEANDDTKSEILEQCRKSIAKYALPKEIVFIDEMPTTKIGKIDFNTILAGYKSGKYNR